MLTTVLSLLVSWNLHAEGMLQSNEQFMKNADAPITADTPIADAPIAGMMINPSATGSYYDWGRGMNGYAYCYQWAYGGGVLNGGNPISNYYCEQQHPSHYFWGRGMNGYGYCYQWTPQGWVLNQGNPVSNFYCDQVAHSYYSWGRGMNGYTYCYQYTSNGIVMNNGNPVSNYYCQ